jgi:hypothetical protein
METFEKCPILVKVKSKIPDFEPDVPLRREAKWGVFQRSLMIYLNL